MDKEIIKFAEYKGKNRRILFHTHLNENEDTYTIISTKRLIDFNKREILKTEILYSLETLTTIREIMNILFDDPEFNKHTNREIGQIQKNVGKIGTNMITNRTR
jgi:hypothetical protein